MISMTGYSFVEEMEDGVYVSIEIRALNNRFMEIYPRMPSELYVFENKIISNIKNAVKRGKIEITITYKEYEKETEVTPNLSVAKSYYQAFNKIITTLNLRDDVKLHHLVKADNLLIVEDKKDASKVWKNVESALNRALNTLHECKKREGEETLRNILELLDIIDNKLSNIKKLAPQQVVEFEKKMMKKMKELLEGNFEEQRIIMEVGILATKVDINEELERLTNHINQFRVISQQSDQVGKHLDFLTQEMIRELNTVGSKTNLIEIINDVVLLKNTVEQIKEQIRNVE